MSTRNMKAFTALGALLLTLMIGRSTAADLTGTFTLPTVNTDGTTIGTTDAIAQVRVEYSICSGTSTSTFGTKLGEVVVPAPGTSYTITGVTFGKYCLRAYAKNVLGVESDATTVLVKDYSAPKPKPPVLGAVSVVAYELNFTPNGIKLGRAVGTVPLGTACGAGYVTNRGTMYEVAREDVTLTRAPKSDAIVAECGEVAS